MAALRASAALGDATEAPLPASRRKPRSRQRTHPSPPPPFAPSEASAPAQPNAPPVNNAVLWHVDKSALPLGEPRRYRDRAHLEFVASQPCLLCGRKPSDAHHLRFMQPRAMGRRVSDEFAVPLPHPPSCSSPKRRGGGMVEGLTYRRGGDCPQAVAAHPAQRDAHSGAYRSLAECTFGAEGQRC
jgi:hypothetical protein